jgi:hypothetical protein
LLLARIAIGKPSAMHVLTTGNSGGKFGGYAQTKFKETTGDVRLA